MALGNLQPETRPVVGKKDYFVRVAYPGQYCHYYYLELLEPSSSTFTTTNRRISILNRLPKMSAMRVLLMMTTLYGMLKSGVARSTSNAEV